MKRGIIILMSIFLLTLVYAEGCDLEVSLFNQDPYPAVPGDYVKVVFQIGGVENPECGVVSFELLEKYPILFDPETISSTTINAGTFVGNEYNSYLMSPYKIRIDENALDGANPLEVEFSYMKEGVSAHESKQFDLEVQDVKADFEITIKNYVPSTNTLTLEILNIGESDIEALTLEIPDQENINIKGSLRNIVGDLDSNDYTTADFEAVPLDGEIMVSVLYTDSINVRRNLQKTISFDSKYFQERAGSEKGISTGTYITILLVVGIIIYWHYRRRKKKQAKHNHRH